MPQSPRVEFFKWGVVRVEGFAEEFKDVKIFPGGAREWDWSETGTRHEPGIQPADVEEILAHGAQVVVLTKGIHERLLTCPETLDMLRERGITVHVLQTERAIEQYNILVAENVAVGILIHSTC